MSLLPDTARIGGLSAAQGSTELVLDEGFFDKGFGAYEVFGSNGLSVAEGAAVDVTMPVLRLTATARGVESG